MFVLDASGNVAIVMLSIEEYKRMASRPTKVEADPESVNRQIMKAQLEEDGGARGAPSAPEGYPLRGPRVGQAPQPVPAPKVDLREEVIDPSFDFEE